MTAATDRLLEEWQRQGVKVNPPAADERVSELERFLALQLPRDVVEYFAKVNGMQDYEMDNHTIGFWSVGRIISDPYVAEGSDLLGSFRDIAFADFMISSAFFTFRIRPHGPLSIASTATGVEFTSFSAFLDEYLNNAEALCFS